MAKFFFVEVTDTFGGEANYSWVTRHKVKASTIRGAVIRLNRDSGLGFHKTIDMGDTVRYDSRSGATCAFIEEWDNEQHGKIGRINAALS